MSDKNSKYKMLKTIVKYIIPAIVVMVIVDAFITIAISLLAIGCKVILHLYLGDLSIDNILLSLDVCKCIAYVSICISGIISLLTTISAVYDDVTGRHMPVD